MPNIIRRGRGKKHIKKEGLNELKKIRGIEKLVGG